MEILLSAQSMVLVGIVVGLTQVAKGFTGARWAPIVALAFGIIGSFLVSESVIFGSKIIAGVMIGLTASGLYSGATTVMRK